MQRNIKFIPCNGNLDMCWYLKGNLGTVVFIVLTNWHLPNSSPKPAFIAYHSNVPIIEGHEISQCSFLEDGQCYLYHSISAAIDVFNILVEHGDEAVWKKLEDLYEQVIAQKSKENVLT